jgi:hypothetical protein
MPAACGIPFSADKRTVFPLNISPFYRSRICSPSRILHPCSLPRLN